MVGLFTCKARLKKWLSTPGGGGVSRDGTSQVLGRGERMFVFLETISPASQHLLACGEGGDPDSLSRGSAHRAAVGGLR